VGFRFRREPGWVLSVDEHMRVDPAALGFRFQLVRGRRLVA
jgi:hypothetical protein